jgi:hypothetical protein
MPHRQPAALLLLLPALAARAADGAVIDAMDELLYQPPKEKGKAKLVEEKIGKAVRFSFDADARSAFFTSSRRGVSPSVGTASPAG